MDLLKNSSVICSMSVVLSLILGSLAGYGFARFKVKAKNNLLLFVLSIRFMPPIAVIIPLFILFRAARLIDTHLGMIALYTMMNLPFAIWLLRGYFQDIPEEIGEAAEIDGCSEWKKFWKIYVPLGLNGIVASAILLFVLCWNEFMFASILTRARAITLPVGAINVMTDRGIFWGEISAGVSFIIAPMIVMFLVISRHLVRGLTMGALK